MEILFICVSILVVINTCMIAKTKDDVAIILLTLVPTDNFIDGNGNKWVKVKK
jgi:hypothetical protein